MAWFETWFKNDLAKPINVVQLQGVMFNLDNLANKIGVELEYNGQPAALEGTIAGYVIRNDGTTLNLTTNTGKEGNKAWVILPQEAYTVEGPISIVIKLVYNSAETTIGACAGYVTRSRTSSEIAPTGTVIPSLASLEAAIAAANAAAANAADAVDYIAPTEEDSTAEAAHAVGSYFIYNGKLMKSTSAIAQGAKIVPYASGVTNYNCAEVPNGLSGDVFNVTNTANRAANNAADAQQLVAPVESMAGMPTSVATKAHPTGSYFVFGGMLYKATADIAIGDPIVTTGTGANAAQVPGGVTGEVADLKSANDEQSGILKLKESVPINATVSGLRYIRYTSGELGLASTGESFSHTDYVYVKSFNSVRYKRIQSVSSTPAFGVAFYDETKTYISGQRALASGSAMSYVDTVVSVPENAVFARFTTLNNIEQYGAFTVSGVNQLQAQMLVIIDDIDESVQKTTELALVGNLWDYGVVTENVSLNSSGNTTSNADYKTTDYIPVVDGEIIYGKGARYAFYDENKTFVPGSSYVLSNTGIELPNGMRYCSVPSGASYFRICVYKTGVTSFPLYKGSILDAITYIALSSDATDYTKKSVYYNNLWRYGTLTYNVALSSSGNTTSNVDYDTTDYIPVNEGDIIYGYGSRYCFYNSEKTMLSGKTGILNTDGEPIGNGMHYITAPTGASYFRVCGWKDPSVTYQFLLYVASPFESNKTEGTSRKLYCLGDSITRGMFAEAGASSSSGPTPYGYPYWIGQNAGYDVVNLGNSGSGWANIGTAETPGDPSTARNAKDVIDDNEFADADIITMAWGVNDWKGAAQEVVLGDMTSESGDGTVIGNMKYCIETLVEKKPTAQLIVLLPLNTNRKWTGMRDMTLEENWAFGYPYRNNQTLQDYRTAIRQCAEYYNVKVIDLEEVCPINRLNLRNMCGDGLHPTKAFYKQMGEALANLVC